MALTEFLRELATMVMLLAPAALVTEKWLERFAWFCFGFGVWDIFYYVFLKALLGWPATWLDRDVLFLVPVVWVGPVLAPCIISLGLITLACILLRKRYLDPGFRPHPAQWASLVLCGALFLYTFVEEPLRFIGRPYPVGALEPLGPVDPPFGTVAGIKKPELPDDPDVGVSPPEADSPLGPATATFTFSAAISSNWGSNQSATTEDPTVEKCRPSGRSDSP